jgi:signal peptidase I
VKLRFSRRWKYGYLFALLLTVLAAGCGGGDWSSGDRVLVAKFLADMNLKKPNRYDVVVFRFPERPIENGTPKNYIKRLLGLPGELLALFFGNIYRYNAEEHGPAEHPLPSVEEQHKWRRERNAVTYSEGPLKGIPQFGMIENDLRDRKLFEQGKFKILRKSPPTLLTMRRPVYDHDHPAKDLEGVLPPRWAGAESTAWAVDKAHGFRNDGSRPQTDWLRYQHILRPSDWPHKDEIAKAEFKRRRDAGQLPEEARNGLPEFAEAEYARRVAEIKRDAKYHKPQLITDFLGYNAFVANRPDRNPADWDPPEPYNPGKHNWVGDLILDCELTVKEAKGEFCMELSKGPDRFQACWELSTGECTLYRLGEDGKRTKLGSKKTRVSAPGAYELKFANVDERLTVWVGRDLPFDDGVPYPVPIMPLSKHGPDNNDLQPASLGSKGAAVEVHHLKLWRDVYYTQKASDPADAGINPPGVDYTDPKTWQPLRDLKFRTIYVQPRHYFCLGDNSAASSDSRDWGLVPERLMLGRALLVYFPFNRAGVIE